MRTIPSGPLAKVNKAVAAIPELVKGVDGSLLPGIYVLEASNEEPDRHGDIISVAGWRLDAFQRNPVLLWMHGMDSNHLLPVGKVRRVWREDRKLLAQAQLDMEDPFAVELSRQMDIGLLQGASVGLRPLKAEPRRDAPGFRFVEQELLEISIVPVPSNPSALVRRGFGYGHLDRSLARLESHLRRWASSHRN